MFIPQGLIFVPDAICCWCVRLRVCACVYVCASYVHSPEAPIVTWFQLRFS